MIIINYVVKDVSIFLDTSDFGIFVTILAQPPIWLWCKPLSQISLVMKFITFASFLCEVSVRLHDRCSVKHCKCIWIAFFTTSLRNTIRSLCLCCFLELSSDVDDKPDMNMHGREWVARHKSDSNSQEGEGGEGWGGRRWILKNKNGTGRFWTSVSIRGEWWILWFVNRLINVGYRNNSCFFSMLIEFVPFYIPSIRMTILNWYSSFSRSNPVLRISVLTLSNSGVSCFFCVSFLVSDTALSEVSFSVHKRRSESSFFFRSNHCVGAINQHWTACSWGMGFDLLKCCPSSCARVNFVQ